MTLQPTTQPARPPRFNETTTAIIATFVIAIVLTSLFVNPFHAMVLAYTDYSHTPAAPGVPSASTVNAPAPESK